MHPGHREISRHTGYTIPRLQEQAGGGLPGNGLGMPTSAQAPHPRAGNMLVSPSLHLTQAPCRAGQVQVPSPAEPTARDRPSSACTGLGLPQLSVSSLPHPDPASPLLPAARLADQGVVGSWVPTGKVGGQEEGLPA